MSAKISEDTYTSPAGTDLIPIVRPSGALSTRNRHCLVSDILILDENGNLVFTIDDTGVVWDFPSHTQDAYIKMDDGGGFLSFRGGLSGYEFWSDDGNRRFFAMVPPSPATSAAVTINDNFENAFNTSGVSISTTGDDELLTIKNVDVSHGITDEAETDTFAVFQKGSAVGGGLMIRGFTDIGVLAGGAIQLVGTLGETAHTGKTASARGIIEMIPQVKSGTGVAAPAANSNILTIEDGGGNAAFIFDVEGSAFADVEWTTFDGEDDLALIESIEQHVLEWQDPLKHSFAEFAVYNAEFLEQHNLVHFDRDKIGHATMNLTRMHMLEVGALQQLNTRLAEVEEWIAKRSRRKSGSS